MCFSGTCLPFLARVCDFNIYNLSWRAKTGHATDDLSLQVDAVMPWTLDTMQLGLLGHGRWKGMPARSNLSAQRHELCRGSVSEL